LLFEQPVKSPAAFEALLLQELFLLSPELRRALGEKRI
jgi:hypothetical protein